jgi:peroxiredoxin
MERKTNWLGIIAIAGVVACVGICAAVGIGLRYGTDIYSFFKKQDLPRVGAPAPGFTSRTLDGQNILLSQFHGKPVLLTFAASWCPDCRAEAPIQQSLHVQHPELVLLLIDSEEQDAAVRGFAREFGMTFPVLLDRAGTVSDQYGIFGIPTTFFLDPDGIIRYVLVGGLTTEIAAEKLPLIGVEP